MFGINSTTTGAVNTDGDVDACSMDLFKRRKEKRLYMWKERQMEVRSVYMYVCVVC